MKNIKWLPYLIVAIVGFISAYLIAEKLLAPKPRVSIITSVWKGDDFIEGFLADITKQTLFPESELIIVNPSSPGNEEPTILKYQDQFPNIIYVKLPKDPGLYACWNHAIKLASSDILTNANIDDRSSEYSIEMHVKLLEEHPEIDLAYAGYLITDRPNETFSNCHVQAACDPAEFSLKEMTKCLPGPRPVWRKSLHDRYGYFDEEFTSAGDMDMWLRATSQGSQFKKIPGYLTLFYVNPEGISTNKDPQRARKRDLENVSLYIKYKHLWENKR